MKIAIFGAGTLAKLALHYLTVEMDHEVICFVIDREKNLNQKPEKFYDKNVYYFDEFQDIFRPKEVKMFIALAYKDMRNRKKVFDRINQLGYNLINIISNSAIICGDIIKGKNNFIMANSVLEPESSIGSNNLIWSNTTICHNTSIGDHNFLAANVTIGGWSKIEDLCFLSFSSTVSDKIYVKNEVLLAANSFLNNNAGELRRFQGNPAKEYSKIDENIGITFP